MCWVEGRGTTTSFLLGPGTELTSRSLQGPTGASSSRRQLGKVSLVSDDAVAMSGPEDRGSSVLGKCKPGRVGSADG